MNRETTLQFLHKLLADLPQAIETGDQLIRLINRAYGKIVRYGDMKKEVTPEDVDRVLGDITRRHARIRGME